MNFVLLFLCSLILIHGCLTANFDRGTSRAEIRHQNKSEIGVQFDALDEDFLYPMFDGSDLQEILGFTKNPRISAFVKEQVFPVKYNNYEFNIQPENNAQVNVDEFDKCLDIHGYDFFLEIIEKFGLSIQKIGIVGSELISEERITEIYQYVNEYCSESLASFSLGTIRDDKLTLFTKPFSRLEDLYLRMKINQFGSIHAFNEIFPQLRRLFLTLSHSSFHNDNNQNRSIEAEVPHMEHLEELNIFGVVFSSHLPIINKQLENLLQKNPQIRRLSFAFKLGHFIQVISNHLQNLEYLSISALDSNIPSVQFNHVKHFTVRGDSEGSFEKLHFPRLESISTVYSSTYEDGVARESWTTFFQNHPHIKKLDCTLHDRADGLVEFLAELPDLSEIQIETSEVFDIYHIGELIETHANLTKFQYHVFAIIVPEVIPDLAIYREKFENQWNITLHIDERRRPSLTLERKYSTILKRKYQSTI